MLTIVVFEYLVNKTHWRGLACTKVRLFFGLSGSLGCPGTGQNGEFTSTQFPAARTDTSWGWHLFFEFVI